MALAVTEVVLGSLQRIAALTLFIIYAAAVLLLHQHHDAAFPAERPALAASVSNVVYHAPLGMAYTAVQRELAPFDAPLAHALAKIRQPDQSPGRLTTVTLDGNGVGFIVVASWSMRLFGADPLATTLFMLLLMGVSVAAFLCRFGDFRAIAVSATFLSLTLMLFTPLVWNEGFVRQIPIGGIRYFSLVAALPAFHIAFEMLATDGRPAERRGWHGVLLGTQVVVLVMAIAVRSNVVTSAAALAAIGLVTAWRRRRQTEALRLIGHKAIVAISVAALFVALVPAILPPRYLLEGRTTTLLWHRAFVSLGFNPAWPFGDLRQVYDCTGETPEGLIAGATDQNGSCVWEHYVASHHVPKDVAENEIYSGRYEAVMRAAFFDVARRYPREVLATFAYYKPLLILASLGELLHLKQDFYPVTVSLLAVLGIMLFAALALSSARRQSRFEAARLVELGGIFAIATVPPYLVAWALPWTSADLLFYGLFCLVLAPALAIAFMRATPGP